MDLKGKICVLIKDIFAISENRLMNHCDLIIGSNTPYVKLIILIKSIAFSYRRCSQIDANFLMRVLRTSLWCDLLIEDRKSVVRERVWLWGVAGSEQEKSGGVDGGGNERRNGHTRKWTLA